MLGKYPGFVRGPPDKDLFELIILLHGRNQSTFEVLWGLYFRKCCPGLNVVQGGLGLHDFLKKIWVHLKREVMVDWEVIVSFKFKRGPVTGKQLLKLKSFFISRWVGLFDQIVLCRQEPLIRQLIHPHFKIFCRSHVVFNALLLRKDVDGEILFCFLDVGIFKSVK